MNEPDTTERGFVRRKAWALAGSACVVLGAIGAIVPLMPATCFLLAALACFARGDPERARRLLEHPRFGPTLRAWDAERAIPGRVKRVALIAIAVAWLVVVFTSGGWVAPAIVGAILLCVGAYVATRPLPASERGERVEVGRSAPAVERP